MKNFIIILLLIAGIWFVYTKIMENQPKKEVNAATNYADNLKKSEEKAEAAKNTANLTVIKQAITAFKGTEGRFPANLDELTTKNYIDRIPQGDYNYDPATGEVSFK